MKGKKTPGELCSLCWEGSHFSCPSPPGCRRPLLPRLRARSACSADSGSWGVGGGITTLCLCKDVAAVDEPNCGAGRNKSMQGVVDGRRELLAQGGSANLICGGSDLLCLLVELNIPFQDVVTEANSNFDYAKRANARRSWLPPDGARRRAGWGIPWPRPSLLSPAILCLGHG